ncbi:MAG: pantoate--beta-alanine ligase [Deltaproteobacteria bacterium]
MEIIEDLRQMRSFSSGSRDRGLRAVLVPTMGYLHDGHRELLRIGRRSGDILILSIFVNPAQFGPKEDFISYPRDMERDLKAARECGADVVFTPKREDIYPAGYGTYAEVEGLSARLCGASRPGHFRGVATVVLKLFNITLPRSAVFGRKDFQQLLIIRKMVEDFNLGVEIIGVDTVREPDGLAMSSRNAYLSVEEREAARCVPASLEEAKEEFEKGVRDTSAIMEKVKKIIEKEPLAVIDYIKICDGATLEDIDHMEGGAHLFVAVRIGRARLMDNCPIGLER